MTNHPLIIYALQTLTNYSFETDADATDPPTGWDDSASSNGVNEVDDAEYHYVGDGLPSLQSVRQNVTGAGGGNKAVLRQRFALSNFPAFMQREGEVEIVAAGMMKAANQIALGNARVVLRQYDGGTSTPGSGTERTSPQERWFHGANDEPWFLRVHAAKLHSTTDWLDLCLEYELGTYDANAHVWWDQAFLGVLLDLPKGFKTVKIGSSLNYNVNHGSGVIEIVKFAPSSSELEISLTNIFEDPTIRDNLYGQIMNFERWLGSDQVGALAFWGDRNYFTNARRHFQEMFVKPKTEATYRPGIARRNLSYKLIAPNER